MKKSIKGILLWITAIACTLLVFGTYNFFTGVILFLISTILCIICYKTITYKDFINLSLYKWFYKKCLL